MRIQRRSDVGSMRTISRMLRVFVEVKVATEVGLTLWVVLVWRAENEEQAARRLRFSVNEPETDVNRYLF